MGRNRVLGCVLAFLRLFLFSTQNEVRLGLWLFGLTSRQKVSECAFDVHMRRRILVLLQKKIVLKIFVAFFCKQKPSKNQKKFCKKLKKITNNFCFLIFPMNFLIKIAVIYAYSTLTIKCTQLTYCFLALLQICT